MEDDKSTAIEDIKSLKGYILGVAALAAGVTAFCTLTFHWDAPKVSAVSAVAAIVFIVLAFLIQRAENRNAKRLEKHIEESNKNMIAFTEDIQYLKKMALETQLATLRVEMGNVIKRQPDNHDTILRYAERYFVELGGDWVMTDTFFEWVDKEAAAGRTVHMPPALMERIQTAKKAEKSLEQ